MNEFKHENITLLNCDCMEFMATIPDNYYELAIVDPPYGIGINTSGRLGHYGGKGKNWDNSIPNDEYFIELYRVSKNQIIWGANYFKMPPTRCFLIWDKEQPESVSFASCEYAWTNFEKSAKTYYQRPQNVDVERIHPTQKPVKLYEWLLTNYAKQGDKILDTHLGSASSAIAANNLGFEFVGMDLDKDYYDASVERFEKHISQVKLFDFPVQEKQLNQAVIF